MARALKTVPDDTNPGLTLEGVLEALELELVLGRLKPRERLVEDELMIRFRAKRHVIRNALIELERLGLVERPRGKGAIVRDYDANEVRDIYDFRADLHRLAVTQMPLPFSQDLLRSLQETADKHELAIENNDLVNVIRHNNLFHDLLFDQCGNRYLVETIRHLAAIAHAIRSYRMGDPRLLDQAAAEHRQMIVAGRSGDREALALLVVQHIEPSKNLYLQERA